MDILDKRIERFKSVISNRQYDLTIVLEDVHDPHNIGAVMRSCDAVGIAEIYIIYTDPRLRERGLEIGHKSSSGTKNWVKINYFECIDTCMATVKKKYNRIYSTKLDDRASSLYDLDLTDSCALLFGNEHSGVSALANQYVDANFLIPQKGFAQSLNISVACAVALFEALRQRENKNAYDNPFGSRTEDRELFEEFKEIHRGKKRK